MSGRQRDDASRQAGAFQTLRELMGSLLADLVFILIEDDVDRTAWRIGKRRRYCGRTG